jgi:hypothetical protein
MSEFKITLEAVWESDGYYEEYRPAERQEVPERDDSGLKRSVKHKRNKRQKKSKAVVETNDEHMSDSEDNANEEVMTDDED